ncbi:hypothetical protein DFH07DRAFT_807363 [Mycena maculata]|uniref:Uncharacterized protein n=1 Tax=Mycena maculata TaxID=230809 RepID=A0AAD7JRI7_9AGAR|nr:hypothetical protein DFH07DRAFT_807363 [Mycena maculata]
MKISATVVTVLSAVALVHAAGTYSITAYNSPSCSTSSTVIETVSGPTNSTCVSFPGGRSLDLVMSGSCSRMTAFFSNNCVAGVGPSPDQTDEGSPWNAGCQTFALNAGQSESFNSFQVFC